MSQDDHPNGKDKSWFAKTAQCWVFTVFVKPSRFYCCPDLVGSRQSKCPIRYIVCGLETCPDTGRRHVQGYLELNSPQRGPAVQKLLASISGFYTEDEEADPSVKRTSIYCRPRRATSEEAVNYCKKDGDFYELGRYSYKKGERTDLQGVFEVVEEEGYNIALQHNPVLASRYFRSMQELHELNICNKRRIIETKYVPESQVPDDSYYYDGSEKGMAGYRSQKSIACPRELLFNNWLTRKYPYYVYDAKKYAEWVTVYAIVNDYEWQNFIKESKPSSNACHSKAKAKTTNRSPKSFEEIVQAYGGQGQQAPVFEEDTVYY